MNHKLSVLFLLLIINAFTSECISQKESTSQQNDWLINGEKYISKIVPSSDGKDLVITNGLIVRSFRITPNFATTGIENLVSGQNYLRSVRPEAEITVNGQKFNIGGLSGQPVQNYLLKQWIDKLTNDDESFQFVRYTVENLKPRFDWKIRKDWISGDPKWPASGKELIVEFKAPEFKVKEAPREILYSDNFVKMDPVWKIYASPANERNSFINEGKPGEIMANENASVYAERVFPEDATGVECFVSPGTDKSSTWGPGVALVFSDKIIKFNLKPGKGCFGIWDGNREQEFGKLTDGQSYHLRMKFFSNNILCEVSEDGKTWSELTKIYCAEVPLSVRIGKMDRGGNNSDSRNPGNIERCHIKYFSFLGKPKLNQAEPSMVKGLVVKVHYEIYDGLPLISKWITVHNHSGKSFVLNRFVSEILAAVEGESSVEGETDWQLPNMHVETDYAFSSMSNRKANNAAVHWMTDSTYTSQVNYALKTPCLLEVRPPIGPEWEIKPGQDFETFRAWELYFDSSDKERKGLTARKMYRTIAPWVTENPVLMHVRSANPDAVKLAVDQCAEVGFEMVIMTFGSGFTMESGDTAYYRKIKELADYAHSKGIALGGYSLLASRSVGTKDDIINPATGKPGGIAYYGNSPCLGSEWGINYFRKIKEMYEATGLDIIEHDGSYPGDICGSTVHPGHKGLEDSQWSQFRTIAEFYQWCRSERIYLNVPDWYYLNGSSKCAMGYREVNWSLPRAQQEIIERQNIYDGTWTKTPSMGWMFVPLTEYQGGGAAATIEPLNEHLEHYGQRLANLFGAGVQACYRGPRLYDTDSTKAVVKKWVSFYKKHRQILDSDIIHLRRADGRDWDGLLHVNPSGTENGLLMLYNPLEEPITRELKIPVYYTGLSDKVQVAQQEGQAKTYSINRDYEIILTVTIPAKGYQYYILK
ncbi:MAG: hypothetical protein WC865_01540 [Bacteroidales bacterium]